MMAMNLGLGRRGTGSGSGDWHIFPTYPSQRVQVRESIPNRTELTQIEVQAVYSGDNRYCTTARLAIQTTWEQTDDEVRRYSTPR